MFLNFGILAFKVLISDLIFRSFLKYTVLRNRPLMNNQFHKFTAMKGPLFNCTATENVRYISFQLDNLRMPRALQCSN